MTMQAPPAGTPAPATPAVPNVQTPPTTAAPAPTAERSTLQQRAAALRAQLDDGGEGGADGGDGASTDTAPDGGEYTTAAPAIRDQNAPPNSAQDARAKVIAERQARIAKFQQRERQQFRAQQQRQQPQADPAAAQQVEQMRARIAELEPLNEVFKDEATFLAAAEARGMDSKKLIEWMRQRLADPSVIAQRQAKTVEDSMKIEIEKLRRELGQTRDEWQREQSKVQHQREAHHRAISFVDQTSKAVETHPHSAALLKRHGPEGLVAFANQFIAPLLGESFELSELHDHMEQFLDEIQTGNEPPKTPPGTSQHPKNHGSAEQTATTLSNALTTERATVTEEVPWASLPLKERARLLKERLERE